MVDPNERSGGLAGPHGAGIVLLGDHQHDSRARPPGQLRLPSRRTLNWRLIWFRLEHADGFVLEVRAKPHTTDGETADALSGVMAMFGGEPL